MKRILITGGASGLGRALAARYAADGWRVLIGDIDERRGRETEAALGGEVRYRALDVTEEASLVAVRDWLEAEWGGLDMLVNNAGVAAAGRIERIPAADWDWVLDINLMGVVRGCRVFVPLFKRQGGGHIVNIASMAGLLNAPVMANYNVAKAGVIALSETLRFELAPWGIRTTVACPSFFQTNLGESLRTPEPGMSETVEKLLASSELDADDVARIIRDGAARGRFMILPHAAARRAWRIKRFLPWLFNRSMGKLARAYRHKLEAADDG